MSSYQVFARKYRPQVFREVVGQDHVVRTLRNAIEQNRLAQAYLLVGPRGIGKTTTARILAKALCCVNGPTADPCGVCDSCREIAAGNSLDVIEIDGASNNKVDQVRELIDNSRYAPTRGKYKIYLIDEVHMLSTGAFNALLKTLEEPPPHVKFIFATTEPEKVLPTVLSRCQRFDLHRIPAPVIAAHLLHIAKCEKIELAADAARAIARGAQGGLRDAESMLDQLVSFCGDKIGAEDVRGVFGFTAPEVVAEFAEKLLARDAAGALAQLAAESEAGRDLLRLLADLIAHLRNLLVSQVNPSSLEGEHDELLLGLIRAQAARVSPARLLDLIDQFAAAEARIRWAPDRKLHFEIATIKAIQTLGSATLDEVIGELTALRRGDPAESAPRRASAPPPTAFKTAKSETPKSETPKSETKRRIELPPPTLRAAEDEPAFNPAPATALSPLAAKLEPPAEVAAPSAASPSAVQTIRPSPEDAAENVANPLPLTELVATSPAELWSKVVEEVRSKRPLIRSWLDLGQALALERDELRVGFARAQKIVVESLGSASNRAFLEEALARHAGRKLKLKFELRDDITLAPPVPAVPAEPSAAPRPEPVPEAVDPMAAFRNDPQIRQALEIFDAEIISVQPAPVRP